MIVGVSVIGGVPSGYIEMSSMGGLVQEVFNDISLEKDMRMWQNQQDDKETNRKRLLFLSQFPETTFKKFLTVEKSPGRKNLLLSSALKTKATNSSKPEEALKFWNQAISFCPAEDASLLNELKRGRAASFYEADHFVNCVEDLIELEERTRADNVLVVKCGVKLSISLTDLDTSGLCDDAKLDKMAQFIGVNMGRGEVTEAPRIETRHETLKGFSDCVSISEEEGRGRFIVAREDIQPGTILATEQSVASVLDKEYIRSHCLHCLAPSPRPTPCSQCSSVIFCSSLCRDQALDSYHRYECLISDAIYRGETEAWQLALRLVASRPLEDWRQQVWRKDDKCGHQGEYLSQDIHTVYNMVTHDLGADRSAPELMKESLTAIFFVRCLESKDYFESTSSSCGSLGPDQLFIAELLHHFMRVAFFNSHEVTQIVRNPVRSWDSHPVGRIGMSLNPSLALINHSCDPNYGRVVRGKSALAFATRKIKKGEEILDVYSGTFYLSPKDSRAAVHQRYNFKCECPACANNWTTLDNMSRNLSKKHVKAKQSALIMDKLREVSTDRWVESVDSEAAAATLIGVLSDVREKIVHPHALVLQAEANLHKALWNLYG